MKTTCEHALSPLGLEVQLFAGELLAKVERLSRACTVARKGDVDVVLMQGDTPAAATR